MLAQYNAQEVEEKWRKFWEKEKIYKFNAKSKKKIFSIDTPPPTVSGKMHIGHAFSYAQQDFIARFHRMKENVFYPFGTDDNGLPTERLIEKLKKIKSKEMSRKEFIEICLKTLKEITPGFIEDWKILGVSADYTIYYSTIDENSRKISQKSFIELFKKGFVYKKKFPTIWCPECQTAIAQAELEDKQESSLFSTLKFEVDGKDLLIATTRPELLPACVAVFVHPKDERYKGLAGKKAKVPLFNYEVPIIEDESADMEKGTGVLMICSYGDKFDVEAINKYKLEPKLILNPNGTLNIENYKDLKIKEAREKILQDLKEKALVKEEKQITHAVNVHDKCGTEIEFIKTEQWFIKILDKKKKLIEQGRKINWKPEFMKKRYENWINGLDWDWNISRDRHFGVPIPVWECKKCGSVLIAEEKELPVDPLQIKKKCRCGEEAEPEKKVLDTWATSSLTPQITLSLINNKLLKKVRKTQQLKTPFSLRPQAHDIIRTWAFYTIVKSLYHENEIPWKNVMISGFVTLEGKKMSKSKGNVIEPRDVFEKYGADALRFWAAGSKLGEDLDYQEKDLIAGKRFLTKLWNASRFVFMNLQDYKGKKPSKLEKIDLWLLQKLSKLSEEVKELYEQYDIAEARKKTEAFFWHELCDNYLEIIKKRIYTEKGQKKESAQYVLYQTLLTILKLMAPVTPFITEEIYQSYFRKPQNSSKIKNFGSRKSKRSEDFLGFEKDKSIHISEWPKFNIKANKEIEKAGSLFLEILSKVRQEKTKNKKPMNAEIILFLEKDKIKKLFGMTEDLKAVTNAKEIKEGKFKVEIA